MFSNTNEIPETICSLHSMQSQLCPAVQVFGHVSQRYIISYLQR